MLSVTLPTSDMVERSSKERRPLTGATESHPEHEQCPPVATPDEVNDVVRACGDVFRAEMSTGQKRLSSLSFCAM